MSSLTIGHPISAAEMLEEVALAARPAAVRQLWAMAAVLNEETSNHSRTMLHLGPYEHKSGQYGQGRFGGDSGGQALEDEDACSSPGIAPWNLAYAQRLLIDRACPLVAAGELPKLTLTTAVQASSKRIVQNCLQASKSNLALTKRRTLSGNRVLLERLVWYHHPAGRRTVRTHERQGSAAA
jgi:hypothetical protein